MLPLVELAFRPGFYSNATDRGAKGRYKGGNHVRFRYGLPEKIGGCTLVETEGGVAQVVGYAAGKIHGIARTLHDWVALDNTKWVSIGTHRKLYVFNNELLYDITPIRRTVTLGLNPFSTTNLSAEVSVNDVNHEAIAGDFVTFSGAVAVAGITISGNYEITEVTDANNYKIVHTAAANATTTGGGAAVQAEYEINIGASGASLTGGYGMGLYGSGTYGTPIALTEDETAAEEVRFWSMDNWGEDLVACPRGGRIYVWDKSVGIGTRAQLIANSPMRNNWIAVAQEERILLSFGSADDSGARDQLLIRWCDQEDYNTWIPTITNRAGDKRVQVGSRLLTAVKTKREIVAFTDSALFGVQFIGGNDVFSVTPLAENVSIAGPVAATPVNDVLFFMGKNNFYIYDGTVKEVPCDVWTFVFKDFQVIRAESVCARTNQNLNEIQWFYPDSTSALNTRYAFFNFREGTWVTGTWDRSAVHDYSVVFRRPYGLDSNGNFVRDEDGDNDVDAAGEVASLDSYLETYDYEIGDGDVVMRGNRLVPDFDELVGTGTITMNLRRKPHGTQTTKGPLTVGASTTDVPIQFKGRQVSLRWDQTGINKRWRMGNWRVGARKHGRR